MDDNAKPIKYRELKYIDILLGEIPCATTDHIVHIRGWLIAIEINIYYPIGLAFARLLRYGMSTCLKIIICLLIFALLLKPITYLVYLIGIKTKHFY